METVMIVGTIASGLSSLQQSRQASATQSYNARVAENNAIQERAWASAEAARIRREGVRQRGRARAVVGASGVDAGTGSVLDVLSDDAIENELDAITVTRQGESRARGFEGQQRAARMEARNIRRAAPLSALTSAMQGGGIQLAEARWGK